jgi:hypothetical protein
LIILLKGFMHKIAIKDCDVVFLSFDEANADRNYADLKRKIPWAKRVHGVEGSDAAHKACAAVSDTEYFLTVDGDTQIDPKFLNIQLDLNSMGMDHTYIFSWCGHTNVNGLKYGNGSLKLWTKTFVNEMKTHENFAGGDNNEIEFCYFDKLFQFNENYSTSYINSTPKQAWRAGFREGVKMSLYKNFKIQSLDQLWWQNYHRLLIWMTVGQDVEHGIWAIVGAREGCYRTLCTQWDFKQVRDFKVLEQLWISTSNNNSINAQDAKQKCIYLGKMIKKQFQMEFPTEPYDAESSAFFKKVYINSPRTIKKTI